jgi:hypothetical protein
VTNAPNKAKETKAAEPTAKPFPIAAVVLPAASKTSVFSRTLECSSAISAIPERTMRQNISKFDWETKQKGATSNVTPPALSQTGP